MKKWLCILLMITSLHCREVYNVTPATNGDGVLVVEGVLNATGRTTINLSRTTKLSDKRIAPEIGAFLMIEGETNGAAYPMIETGSGIYQSDSISFDASSKYRLRITTGDNRQYASEFKNFVITPPVDSLTWEQTSAGVNIFAHAHDDLNNTLYYKIDYEEAWSFNSAFRVTIGFREVPPGPTGNRFTLNYLLPSESVDTTLFVCYNDRKSSDINIVSTESLGTNVLFYPFRNIKTASIELSVLYSILVKQYALSKEGYEFFVRMKKNTESLGSIFDAQPSEISGNVKSLTDPTELVMGYVDFTTIETKRLFISNEQLNSWGYDLGCTVFVEPNSNFSEYPYPNNPDLFENIYERGLRPTTVASTDQFGGIKTFNVAMQYCMDCRLRGSNIKPDFWP